MVATPSNYNDAYFEIRYLRVFTKFVYFCFFYYKTDINANPSGTSKTGTSPGASGNGGSNGNGKGNGALSLTNLFTLLGATILPVVITFFIVAA